jgi:hypothetical protein
VLVPIGINKRAEKHTLELRGGVRESTRSWGELASVEAEDLEVIPERDRRRRTRILCGTA